MAVTLKDIAEQIGVSNQAVSAVLNSKTNCRVSKEKRERILKLARDLNYQANMSASILRGRRSKLIGIFVDSFARYRTLRLLQEIERLSSKRGYRIVTSFTHDNIAHMKADYLQFQRYGISDFICCAHDYPEFREEIADLFTGAENVVFMEKPCLPGMPYVRTSRVRAMTAMIAEAYRKGCRRFGNLYGHHAMQTEYNQKLNTYQQKSSTWTAAIRESKEAELSEIVQRLNQFQQTAQEDLANMQQTLMMPIYQKAQEAINKIGKDNNLIYIFDTSAGSIIYLDEEQSMNLLPQAKAALGIPAEKVAPSQL